MSLIGIKQNHPAIIAAGLFGAALIYGDGAVTPSISVLSALEGLNMVTPAVRPYVLPGAVVILVLLFAVQPLGTNRIGKAFGPIMTLWFLALVRTGVSGVLLSPQVFAAAVHTASPTPQSSRIIECRWPAHAMGDAHPRDDSVGGHMLSSRRGVQP